MKYFAGINIINIGHSKECKTMYQREFSDYWGIQYNHKGNFIININDHKKIVNGPHVLLTRPGFSYVYGSPKGETRHHCFVCFNGEKIKKYIDGGLLPKQNEHHIFPISHPEIFYKHFIELKNLFPVTIGTTDMAIYLLEGLLLLLHKNKQKKQTSIHLTPSLKKLSEEIREKPELEWDFHSEAATIAISYMHFRRAFREYIGIPPNKYLQHCRLDHAAEQLLMTQKEVGKIAEESGFEDQQYFSRAFKQYINITPTQYRKEFGLFS